MLRTTVTVGRYSPERARMLSGRALLGMLILLLVACANHPASVPRVGSLPPLLLNGETITTEQALAATDTPRLLEMNDDMREVVDRYVTGSQRQRLRSLHRSLVSPALVGIEYDPAADGTASQVFNAGAANCLSYAHLFVAMARYAGLDARYLSVSLRPEWSRHGDQLALRKHVNVRVRLRNGEEYVVDIDPISRSRMATADVLDDQEAAALYHGNIAMDALLEKDLRTAYVQAIRALALGPGIDYLWVNLGAIYRQTRQDDAAEAMYQHALALNPDSRSAMNNLAVLYQGRNEEDKANYWQERIRERQEYNPFYHIYLGETAEASGDLDTALTHYLEAIELDKSDSEFYYRVARLYAALQEREESRRFIVKAIENARLVGERELYREFLRELEDGEVTTAQVEAG